MRDSTGRLLLYLMLLVWVGAAIAQLWVAVHFIRKWW